MVSSVSHVAYAVGPSCATSVSLIPIGLTSIRSRGNVRSPDFLQLQLNHSHAVGINVAVFSRSGHSSAFCVSVIPRPVYIVT